MQERPGLDTALREGFVQIVERLGFGQVADWGGEGVLFRAGSALLQVVESSGLVAEAPSA